MMVMVEEFMSVVLGSGREAKGEKKNIMGCINNIKMCFISHVFQMGIQRNPVMFIKHCISSLFIGLLYN